VQRKHFYIGGYMKGRRKFDKKFELMLTRRAKAYSSPV